MDATSTELDAAEGHRARMVYQNAPSCSLVRELMIVLDADVSAGHEFVHNRAVSPPVCIGFRYAQSIFFSQTLRKLLISTRRFCAGRTVGLVGRTRLTLSRLSEVRSPR